MNSRVSGQCSYTIRVSYLQVQYRRKLNVYTEYQCYQSGVYITGENVWLDRGSNPGPFADRANTLPLSYRATRSYHQQFFT